MPNPDYRLYADIYGGYGVRVTDPKDIQPLIGRALEHAAAGRLAVIDVVLSDYIPAVGLKYSLCLIFWTWLTATAT